MTPRMRMPILRQIRQTPDGPWWRRVLDWGRSEVVYEVVEDFRYTVQLPDGTWNTVILPAGFRSDLASTPRISWLFGFRPDGPLLLPGLFHDFYYRHGFLCGGEGCRMPHMRARTIGKGWGDALFAHIARETCGLKTPAFVALAALTLFGWPAWRANAKYRQAARRTGKLQLHGDYTDDHDDPAQPA